MADESGRLADGRMVLCAANNYEMKYFFNKHFDKLPESIKEDLKVICILFVQEVGGIFKIILEEDGDVTLETEANEEDVLYDDISAGVTIGEIRRTRQDMFQQISLYYRVFILKEDPSLLLDLEDEEA